MKKILCVMLSAVLLCAMLAGCTKQTEQETGAPEQTTLQAVSESVPEETETAGEPETEAGLRSNADVATYAFTKETFPVLDGSTATVPLGKAVVSVLLGESPEEAADLVQFNRTTQSFRNLKDGYCDLLIVGEPNAAVFEEMEQEGFAYELEEIATDALIFVVNNENPVDNLTTEQIRDIYSGRITNWKEVGGEDAPIIPFQRNEGAGSQALMKKLVMKDTPLTDAPSTLVATEMGELMESVKSYDNSANAIGYSVYYYANDMKKAEGLKILSVDGVAPEAETIRSRKYPHLNAYYCVIGSHQPEDSPARMLFQWMMSKDGQRLVDAEGYVAAKDPEELATELAGGQIVKTDYTYYRKLAIPENRFTRLAEGELTEVKAGSDYGMLYPYTGSVSYSSTENGYSYKAGTLNGFFDENGRLVTDPVYSEISAMTYYDSVTGVQMYLPFWEITRAKTGEEESMEYSFLAMDGSMVCGKWYDSVWADGGRILCENYEKTENGWIQSCFEAFDTEGVKVFSSDQLAWWGNGDGQMTGGVEYEDGWYLINSYLTGRSVYVREADGKELDSFVGTQIFRDGRAVAGDPAYPEYPYHLGVIDEEGQWIIAPEYEQIERILNGNFVCSDGQDRKVLVDRNGKQLTEFRAAFIEQMNYGFTARDSYNQGGQNHSRCMDFEGNVLYEDPSGEWESLGRDGFLKREAGAGIQLKNIITGKTSYLEGAEWAGSFYLMESTPDLSLISANNYYYDPETGEYYNHEWVFDNDLNLLFDRKKVSLSPYDDVRTGDWYFLCVVNDSRVCIMDYDFREVLTVGSYPRIVNGKFIVTDDYTCTCYSRNGEIVFSYSLLNSQGD